MNKEIKFEDPHNVGIDTANCEWVRVVSADGIDHLFSREEYDLIVTLKPKKLPEPREVWVRNDRRGGDTRLVGYTEPEGLLSGDEVFINALGYTSWNAKGVFYSSLDTNAIISKFKTVPYFLHWFYFDRVEYDD